MKNDHPMPPAFVPRPADESGVVSFVHIGDLHMVRAGEENHRDLLTIVETINKVFTTGINFVFLPGDIADDGSLSAFHVVREALELLEAPWCAILGDHDVHEKSFTNFLETIAPTTHGAFTVGNVRFFRLNAFAVPVPHSFTVDAEQLQWLEGELKQADASGFNSVLLLHCYPSELKQGGEQLHRLISEHNVRLVDMGHTHYNEVSNDGKTLYAATRSTGQIEEGQVGFSVLTLDDGVVGWKFFKSAATAAVMITSPADERFVAENPGKVGSPAGVVVEKAHIRAGIWSAVAVVSATAVVAGIELALLQIGATRMWEATLNANKLSPGLHKLQVLARFVDGTSAEDVIRIVVGAEALPVRRRALIDHENAIDSWEERELLGTQLGPNKNGRKW